MGRSAKLSEPRGSGSSLRRRKDRLGGRPASDIGIPPPSFGLPSFWAPIRVSAIRKPKIPKLPRGDDRHPIGLDRASQAVDVPFPTNRPTQRLPETRLEKLRRLPRIADSQAPEWQPFPQFLKRRCLVEETLLGVVQEAWVPGVSTRSMKRLAGVLGTTNLSRSQPKFVSLV